MPDLQVGESVTVTITRNEKGYGFEPGLPLEVAQALVASLPSPVGDAVFVRAREEAPAPTQTPRGRHGGARRAGAGVGE